MAGSLRTGLWITIILECSEQKGETRNLSHDIGEEILVEMDWNPHWLSCYLFSDFMQLCVNLKNNFLFHHQQVTKGIV